MAVEPSNSAEKRILDLVAEGGEDAIKPSPTRTIVSAGENKRKLEVAMSASGLQWKKERVARFVLSLVISASSCLVASSKLSFTKMFQSDPCDILTFRKLKSLNLALMQCEDKNGVDARKAFSYL